MPHKSTPRVADDPRDFRRRLLRWFRRHGRDLPWRRTRDPYRGAGLGVHAAADPGVAGSRSTTRRFLARFPTVHAPGRRAARRGAGGLGGTGLLPPRRTTCTPWHGGRRRARDGVIPDDPRPAPPAARRRTVHRRRRRLLRLRAARSRRWTPTSPASSAAPSIPAHAGRRGERHASGRRREVLVPRRGRARGRSIRRSWSWERWSVRRGWRGVGSVRCGGVQDGAAMRT